MSKKLVGKVKMILQAGKATPAPPVSTTLGAKGIQLKAFCDLFNAKTKDRTGQVTACVKIYEGKLFDVSFIGISTTALIKQELKLTKCAQKPGIGNVAKISMDQVTKIAKLKMEDNNCNDLEAMEKSVIGTAKSMGIVLE